MPTYEYKCPDCGHEFEEFQSMTANPVRKCPSCGQRKVRRLISSGLQPIFKGSGFYETDYVKKSGKSEDAKESDGAKESDKASAKDDKSKAETKPDSKPESKPVKAPEKTATKPKPDKK